MEEKASRIALITIVRKVFGCSGWAKRFALAFSISIVFCSVDVQTTRRGSIGTARAMPRHKNTNGRTPTTQPSHYHCQDKTSIKFLPLGPEISTARDKSHKKSCPLPRQKLRRQQRFNSYTLKVAAAIRFHPQVSTFVQLSSNVRKALYSPFVIIFADWNFQCHRNSQPTTPTLHPHCRSFPSHWRFIILDTSSANSPGGQERSSFHPKEHHQASPGTCS